MSGDHEHGLIDTNVVIFWNDLDRSALPKNTAITAITLAEVSAGPHHTTDDLERARRLAVVQYVEGTFDPLPFDTGAARAFGQVSGAVLAAGRRPRRRTADLMIAATAIANDLPLFTMNPKDFVGLEKILTVVPVERPAATMDHRRT